MKKNIKHLLHATLNAKSIANNISLNHPYYNPVSDCVIMPSLQIKILKHSNLKLQSK